jgi:hypothetical protein
MNNVAYGFFPTVRQLLHTGSHIESEYRPMGGEMKSPKAISRARGANDKLVTLCYNIGVNTFKYPRLHPLDATIDTLRSHYEQVLRCERHTNFFRCLYTNSLVLIPGIEWAPRHHRPIACKEHRLSAAFYFPTEFSQARGEFTNSDSEVYRNCIISTWRLAVVQSYTGDGPSTFYLTV